MDLKSFNQTIQQIAEEKGIAREKVIETIELAFAAAYKRDYGKKGQIIKVTFDPESGKVEVRQIKIVVDESMLKTEEEIEAEEKAREEIVAAKFSKKGLGPELEEIASERIHAESAEGEEVEEDKRVRFNPEKHIILEEAQKIKPDAKPEDELEFPLEFHEEYGRIAAQTAKQVIIQRIREAEREAVFDEYKNKEGELISGLVQRIEGRNIFLDVGRTTAVLPYEEQIPGERYRIGERIKALVILVEKNPKGPGIFLSRSHPRILRKLFELEVPEIAAGTVEIKAVSREAGQRSKVAVVSNEQGVDPVGSMVGQKGVRVTTVIQELGGEKVDIIGWSEDPARFVASALSPAKVLDVDISEKKKEARAIVPDEQLSLAIGKGGQNVRLAAKLTGWKIDVRSGKKPEESQAEEAPEEEKTPGVPKAALKEGESRLTDVEREGVREALAEVMGGTKPEDKKEPPSAKASADAKALADKPGGEEKPKKKRTVKKKKEDKKN